MYSFANIFLFLTDFRKRKSSQFDCIFCLNIGIIDWNDLWEYFVWILFEFPNVGSFIAHDVIVQRQYGSKVYDFYNKDKSPLCVIRRI